MLNVPMKIRVVNFTLGIVFLIIPLSLSYGQTCLELLDSAEFFKDKEREKTIFYGNLLLEQLAENACNEDIGLVATYNNLGLAFWQAKEQPRALHAFKMALAGSETFEDSLKLEFLEIYYNLTDLSKEMGKFSQAEGYFRYADNIVRLDYGAASINGFHHMFKKGTFYKELGEFEESIEAFDRAEIIANKINIEDSLRVDLLIEIGTTYSRFGNFEAGEEKLIEAAKIAKDSDQELYLRAIDRLSALKIEQGEYSDSESYLLHNLQIKSEQGSNDALDVLETLNGLGMLYYKINDLEAAKKHLEDALELSKDIKTIRPYMTNNLGTVYMRLGDTQQALAYLNESARDFRSLFGSMHPDYASCMNNLASANKEMGNLEEALNLYMKVLDMDKVFYGIEHFQYATTLNNIGLVYLKLGYTSLAGKQLKKAKDIRKIVLGEHHPAYIKSLNDLGLYHLLAGDTLRSLEVFDEAILAEIDHMSKVFPVLTRQQRKLYFKQTKYNIERFCSLAFADRYLGTVWAETALNHFINTKGILFYASDKMRKQVQSSDDDQIKDIYKEWKDKKYKLAQAYLLSHEELQKRGLSIEKLEEETGNLEKKLSLKFKVFSDQEKSHYINWQDISAALPDSSVAVEVIQYRKYEVSIREEQMEQGFEDLSRYVAFIVKPEGRVTPVRCNDNLDFSRMYKLYKNSLKYGLKDIQSYTAFWEPIDDKLPEVNRVYMAPDGIYYKINPAVFWDVSKQKHVSDKYDIINITSSKDFLNKESKKLIKRARIFGNPAFETLQTAYGLAPLPGAEREAKEITETLDVRKWRSESYYFGEATESEIKKLDNPGVVHIATHGYFNEDPNFSEPLNSSGLFLSKGEESKEDGILSAYEAMNLVLDKTSVVVLAACETGLGTVQNGEGVFGLQRAFLVAGADNVLISYVKINDEAARRFMNLYYEQLREQEDPQKAFFSARSFFKEEFKNPYDWGAYVLVSRN